MEKESLDELSNITLSILEIIGQQHDVHILLVKGQLQEMSKITGHSISSDKFEGAIDQLEEKNLIKRLEFKTDTLIITPEGRNYL